MIFFKGRGWTRIFADLSSNREDAKNAKTYQLNLGALRVLAVKKCLGLLDTTQQVKRIEVNNGKND
jgi:hypothetical protein